MIMNVENLKVYTTHKEWDKGVGVAVGIVAGLRLSVVLESEDLTKFFDTRR